MSFLMNSNASVLADLPVMPPKTEGSFSRPQLKLLHGRNSRESFSSQSDSMNTNG